MKKICFAIILSVFLKGLLLAQSFKVGDTTCNYKVVNKTFTITCPPLIYTQFLTQSDNYSLDIDGDAVMDINIQSYCSTYGFGSGNAYMDEAISVSPVSNTELSMNTPCSLLTGPSPAVKNLTAGTALNSSLTWSNVPGKLYYYYFKYSSPFSITCGSQTNMFYYGFRKILSGDTIYGWILMNTNWPGKIISYASKRSSGILTSPAFTNTNSACAGQSFVLTASPSGGTFNGPGVSGNTFMSASTGTFPVYYTNGCVNAATLNLIVNPSPSPVFTNTLNMLCPGDSLVLQASPPGGVFSGANVTGNVFHASGIGTLSPVYTSTNSYGCSAFTSYNIVTAGATPISVSSSSAVSCTGQSVNLSASGAGSFTWSTGQTTPSISVSPTISTTYTVNGISAYGTCSNAAVYTQTVGTPTVSVTTASSNSLLCPGQSATLSAAGALTYTWNTGATTQTILVNPSASTTYSVIGALTSAGGCSNTAIINQAVGSPTILAVSSSSMSCPGTLVKLTAGGAMSYIWSTGATTPSCSISPTTTTTYSVIGVNPGGCSDTILVTQMVAVVPPVSVVSSQSLICAGDSVSLTLGGGSGYIIEGGPIYVITSLSSLVVNPNVTTTFTITGTHTNGCNSIDYFTQYVNTCTGVNEISDPKSNLVIFPNPNSGEFEIKSSKEETVMISNELGQALQTYQLNSENNFSVKVNGLSGGVYFVGNNSGRQKIVAIR